MPASSPPTAQLRDLIQALIRTLKSHRLYRVQSAITVGWEDDLERRLREAVAEAGRLDLVVRGDRILVDGQVIYQSSDPKESLAYLLFRDGIRQLSFLAPVDRSELEGFLACLSQISIVGDQSDDLVTLLWQRDLRSIRCLVVDELAEESSVGAVEQQVAEGVFDRAKLGSGGVGSGAVGTGSTEAPPLQRPAALPLGASRLSTEELVEIQDAMAGDADRDLLRDAVDLAVELVGLETSQADKLMIGQTLAEIVARRVISDRAAVEQVLVRLDSLVEPATSTPRGARAAQFLIRAIGLHFTAPECLPSMLAALDQDPEVDASARRLLGLVVGSGGGEMLLAEIERLRQPTLRRAVSETLASVGEPTLAWISKHLSAVAPPLERDLVDEVLFIIRQVPGDAGLPILARLLHEPEPEVVYASALVLRSFAGARAGRLWSNLLTVSDRALRRLAVTALTRSGDAEYARPLLECLASSELDHDVEEMATLAVAVGTLGGDATIGWFVELGGLARRRWWLTQGQRDLRRAAIRGIAAVGSPAAAETLEQLAATADRFTRERCREELGVFAARSPRSGVER